jgi:hypothetical protein
MPYLECYRLGNLKVHFKINMLVNVLNICAYFKHFSILIKLTFGQVTFVLLFYITSFVVDKFLCFGFIY